MEKVALVTGGTSGIGLALCEQFASHGIALVIVSHNQENLDQTSAFFDGEIWYSRFHRFE